MENNSNNPGRDADSSCYSFQSGPSSSLSLTTELQQGKDLARQLQILLLSDQPPHSAAFCHHTDTREVLVQRIIASFDRATSIAQMNEPLAAPSPPPSLTGAARSDSPLSGGANSPRSDDSDPINGDPDSRKRHKVQPRWKTTVGVSVETGFEGPPGDGYNWRKYGQKDILGANYPRAYYRCALKQQTNCPATKQVQRTDEDPSLFEVTYKAVHTCNHPGANPTSYPSSSSSHPNQPPRSTETLISFTPTNNNASFIVPPNTDFHHQQHLQANPNHGFHFQASSSAPTTTASATINQAATSVSATSSSINATHDFDYDQFDFDDSEFFH